MRVDATRKLRPLTRELAATASAELNENEADIEYYLGALRAWVVAQPHLRARTSDQFLIAFLRSAKYSLERAKQRLENFYVYRTMAPEIFYDRDPNDPKIDKIIDSGALLYLPIPAGPGGPRVAMLRTKCLEMDKYTIPDVVKVGAMAIDVLLYEDDNALVSGYIVIMDLADIPGAVMRSFDPNLFKRLTVLANKMSPTRMKGFHFLNVPSVFEKFFNMFKTVINEKLRDRFDFSNWNFPEDRIWIRMKTKEIIIKTSTFLPIILFGLYGNFIMLRLIVLNRSLRTPTNLIVANMAVADFLALLICPAMFMMNDFYQNYQLGCVGCRLEGFVEASILITAVLNLSVVSYDRLTAIVLPSQTRLTMWAAKVVIAVTWLAGFLIAMPLAIYRTYRVRQWKNFKEMYCKENPNILPKYWYVLITVMVWLPLGIMVVCYSAIFWKLDRYEKRILNREHPLAVSYKKTVAKTLFIVVIVFIVLRLPFTVLIILRDQMLNNPNNNTVNSSFRILWYISQYLMFLNAAVNPLIYGLNNDNFRRAYEQTPLFNCCGKPTQGVERPPAGMSKCTRLFRTICCCAPAHDDKMDRGERPTKPLTRDGVSTKQTEKSEPKFIPSFKQFDNEKIKNPIGEDEFI